MIPQPSQSSGKIPASSCLTDGAGLISSILLKSVQRNLRLEDQPSAIQFRCYGAKGVSVLSPEHHSPPTIALRPSQVKIGFDQRYKNDKAKLTFDVVRISSLRIGAALSGEAIVILAANGVPNSVFVQLFQESIHRDFEAFLTWPQSESLALLIDAVVRLGGVMGERRARLAGGAARARGLTSGWKSPEETVTSTTFADNDEDDDDTLYEATSTESIAWFPDDISGLPSSLAETCILLLLAGFRPDKLAYCRKKLENFLRDTITRRTGNYKIAVPYSVAGIIAPGMLCRSSGVCGESYHALLFTILYSRSHRSAWSWRNLYPAVGAHREPCNRGENALPHR